VSGGNDRFFFKVTKKSTFSEKISCSKNFLVESLSSNMLLRMPKSCFRSISVPPDIFMTYDFFTENCDKPSFFSENLSFFVNVFLFRKSGHTTVRGF